MSDLEILQRMELLNISKEELNLLSSHKTVIEANIDGIMDYFYEKQAQLTGDTDILRGLRSVLHKYVIELFSGNYDSEYVNSRARIGMVHKRIGLEPKFYLSAVRTLKDAATKALKKIITKPEILVQTLNALDKLIYFDTTLVFDTYIDSLVGEIESAKNKAEAYAEILEEKVAERTRQLKALAHTDALTGLPNRRVLETQMEQAMLRAMRHNRLLAVCMLDLDDFKPINDTYGHEIGDEVLMTLGKRLSNTLRKSNFIARYGGDEFVLLLEDLAGHADLTQVLQKIEAIITVPIRLSNGKSVQIEASMGVVLYPFADADQADQLLRWSDQALYAIKAHKADRENYWMVFGEYPYSDQRNPAQVLLDNGALEVWYQPILDNFTRKVVGLEALARLRDTEGKLWTPTRFLPELQTADLTTLTKGVLSQALLDLAVLDGQGYSLWVSVNLDAHSVSAGCVECLRAQIAPSNIDPSRITLEILEGDEFLEQASSIEHLIAMKQLGVQLALDDLGSAYGSLLRLKTLPFDKIKLDQSFVRTLEKQPRDLCFVNTVQDLSTSLGVTLVVEGVETEDILDAVTVAGVSLLQGYAIARPLPLKELQKFLRRPALERSTYPQTFLGLYALHLTLHSVLEKTARRHLRLMDHKEMGDHGACPLHGAMQHLGVLEGSPLDQRHRDYHNAIAKMVSQLSVSPDTGGWGMVKKAQNALEEAILDAHEWVLLHKGTKSPTGLASG